MAVPGNADAPMNSFNPLPRCRLRKPPPAGSGGGAACGMLICRNVALLGVLILVNVLTPGIIHAGEAAPLDRALAEQVYLQAERWVERGAVPERSVAVKATDVAAVRVSLRLSGRRLGQGQAAVDDPTTVAAGKPTDAAELARQAVADALDQAAQSLVQLANLNPDAAIATDLTRVGPLLQVDVQVARAPQALAMERIDQLPRRIVVDVHGLAMRRGKRWAWLFPGDAVAGNLGLDEQVNALLSQVGLNPTAVPTINQADGPKLHAFTVIHLLRPASGKPVRELHRGQVVERSSPPDFAGIDAMARQWAEVLIRRQDGRGRFAGTYLPTADRFEPRLASTQDAALACYALAKYSRSAHLPNDLAEHYAHAAGQGVQALAAELTDANEPALRVADAATTLLAILETPGVAELKAQRDRLARVLIESFAQSLDQAKADQQTEATPTDALAALALVRYHDRTRDAQALATAHAALGMIWGDARQASAASVMPWAALAEFDLLRLQRATPGIAVVKRTAESYWDLQVHPPGPTAPNDPFAPGYVSPDTMGGFVLDAAALPEPTWRSADALIVCSAALASRGMVDAGRRTEWLLDCAAGFGYLRQLTMTDHTLWYTRSPADARGGVRIAFWDNRQPLAATALALVAVAEYAQALTSLAEAAGD